MIYIGVFMSSKWRFLCWFKPFVSLYLSRPYTPLEYKDSSVVMSLQYSRSRVSKSEENSSTGRVPENA